MGAPLIKGGGPSRKRKKKKKTEELLPCGRRQVKGREKYSPVICTPTHIKTRPSPPTFSPFPPHPTIKKKKKISQALTHLSSAHALKRKEARVVIRKPQFWNSQSII
jgi:hypothetical protein